MIGSDIVDVIQVPGQLILKYDNRVGGPNQIRKALQKEFSPAGSKRENQRFKA